MPVSRTCDMGMGACVGERGSRVRGACDGSPERITDPRHHGFRCSLTSNRRLVSIRSTETGLLCGLAHQSAPKTVALCLQVIQILDDPVVDRKEAAFSTPRSSCSSKSRPFREQFYRELNPGMDLITVRSRISSTNYFLLHISPEMEGAPQWL
ncbi:uncharacterized protein SCHCODRAFT_02064048 [Schizophyllum commune H4-8]|uniref:uncharacterized protein n=1 Tax=Schizophyllum commune (strain H4-8 / FGSC 9210) TaxID=578458 RepID=UPI00215FFD08|nr:uncharacterized protein SCHCODRAFT_02064048 [Schizophyllum commune H4-8]KAI5888845.1 hypothetical protein SCHCODRAFT_02064048 [Schizophyllum commune H4-8]